MQLATLEGEEFLALLRAMDRLGERLTQTEDFVTATVGAYVATARVAEVRAQMNMFRSARKAKPSVTSFDIPPDLAPLFVTALRDWRFEKARNYEAAAAKVVDRNVVQHLADELDVLNDLLTSGWVTTTPPASVPELQDFLVLEIAERANRNAWAAQPRRYDEKFHVLQAPDQIESDLDYLRNACRLRERPVGIAFVDVDDFKAFNSKYGEVVVDVAVLPRLMRVLEASVFGHGFAYRQGGDEYVIVLPNISEATMRSLLDNLRAEVAALQFDDVSQQLTVSIGYVTADPHSFSTNRETLAAASRWKDEAKRQGKNRVLGGPMEMAAQVLGQEPQ